MPRSLARGRGKRKCVLVVDANMESAGTEKRAKKKTDEGSSVLLYLMTEEGEREEVCAASRAEVTLDKDVVVVLETGC